MFLSKNSLDRNNTTASLFGPQYTPDFLIAEYYGLRNTTSWVTQDLASDLHLVNTHFEAVSQDYSKLGISSHLNKYAAQ
jgi:hypothetical protein